MQTSRTQHETLSHRQRICNVLNKIQTFHYHSVVENFSPFPFFLSVLAGQGWSVLMSVPWNPEGESQLRAAATVWSCQFCCPWHLPFGNRLCGSSPFGLWASSLSSWTCWRLPYVSCTEDRASQVVSPSIKGDDISQAMLPVQHVSTMGTKAGRGGKVGRTQEELSNNSRP